MEQVSEVCVGFSNINTGEILRLVIKHYSHSEDDKEKTISSWVNEPSKVTGILPNKVYSRTQLSAYTRKC